MSEKAKRSLPGETDPAGEGPEPHALRGLQHLAEDFDIVRNDLNAAVDEVNAVSQQFPRP
jgi:hypothetical protein